MKDDAAHIEAKETLFIHENLEDKLKIDQQDVPQDPSTKMLIKEKVNLLNISPNSYVPGTENIIQPSVPMKYNAFFKEPVSCLEIHL